MNIKKVGVLCAIMLAMTVTTKAQNFVGDWKGAISIQGMSLEMIFHISEEGGAYRYFHIFLLFTSVYQLFSR